MIHRIDAVLGLFGYRSHASIYTSVLAGVFTEPVKIGPRAVGWPANEVDAILKARIGGKTDDQIRDLVKKLHAARVEDGQYVSDFAARSARVRELASRRVKTVVA